MQHTLSTLIKSPISDDLKLEIQGRKAVKTVKATLGFHDWLFPAVQKNQDPEMDPLEGAKRAMAKNLRAVPGEGGRVWRGLFRWLWPPKKVGGASEVIDL